MTEGFVSWPGIAHLKRFALSSALVGLCFGVVFVGADFVTSHRTSHWSLFFAAELGIPLWPGMILVYDSLYLFFMMIPFVVRTREELNQLAGKMVRLILIAGIIFLLIPARLGFPTPDVSGPLKTLFHVSDRLNLDYNLIPSLHVGLAVLCLLAFWKHATVLVRCPLTLWTCALSASTVVTHQHHILDVLSGATFAVLVHYS